ncbi:hypothetical protein ACLK17_19580 [Escherichia coli]
MTTYSDRPPEQHKVDNRHSRFKEFVTLLYFIKLKQARERNPFSVPVEHIYR